MILLLTMSHHVLVYKLALDSALLGQECVICFEEFIQGNYDSNETNETCH